MSKFHEGQRVRVVQDLVVKGSGHHIGSTGTMATTDMKWHNNTPWELVVRLDSATDVGGEYYFFDAELEAI